MFFLKKIKNRSAEGNILRFLGIAVIIGFISIIMITDAFSHNSNIFKWMDYTFTEVQCIRLNIWKEMKEENKLFQKFCKAKDTVIKCKSTL